MVAPFSRSVAMPVAGKLWLRIRPEKPAALTRRLTVSKVIVVA